MEHLVSRSCVRRILLVGGCLAAIATTGVAESQSAKSPDPVDEIEELQERTNQELDEIQALIEDVERAIASQDSREAARKLSELGAAILRWELASFAIELEMRSAARGEEDF